MNENNSDKLSLPQALNLINDREKDSFCLEKINLTKLQRLAGITRAKLRRLKENRFKEKQHGLQGCKSQSTVLSGFIGIIDNLHKIM